MDTKYVHVIAKGNSSEHHVKEASLSSLPALADGQVRAESLLVGLTSNNLAYATNGTALFWWDTFPVPANLPAPYNDQSLYGIVPCWGYGEVLESKVDGIDAGRLIWGFWPSSDLPVDLKLKAGPVDGHYIEVSDHRSRVFNLYQRYELADPQFTAASLDDKNTFELLARRANTRAVYEAGYLLSNAVFGQSPVHPLGFGEWSVEAADLSSAVVISLSGSGRTARSFTDSIFHDRPTGAGPLSFLAITSNPKANVFRSPPIPTEVVPYQDMTAESTFAWIARQKPKKIVVVDFGGRDNAFDTLFAALEKAFSDIEVMAIGCGAEAKAPRAEDVARFLKRNALPNRTMMNTTGIRDAKMKSLSEEQYFRGLEKAWQGYLERGSVDDLKLDVGEGTAGHRGFEGGWSDLCTGKLPGDTARVYRM